MTLVLVLDAASDGCLAGVVRDGRVLAERQHAGGRGSSAVLPSMAADVLHAAGVAARQLDAIAVTVGPGSFTGVRAALALAHGIGLAAGVAVRGVTVGAALRQTAGVAHPVWVAIDNRRGRVFLDDGTGPITTIDVSALPDPATPIAVAGDAARAVAAHLVARGHDVTLLPGRMPDAVGIAAAPGVPPLPLYVDAVAAQPNAARAQPA